MKEFVFNWRIENISYAWHEFGEWFNSPYFKASPIQNTKWCLQLCPRGHLHPDYIALFLSRGKDKGPSAVSINFEFSCISAQNSPIHTYTFFESDKTFAKNHTAYGHPRYLRRHEVFISEKGLYLQDDVLTLRCRMWKDEGTVNECEQCFGRTVLLIERISLVQSINLKASSDDIVRIYSRCQNKELMSINISHNNDFLRIVINPKCVEDIKYSILELTFVEKTTRRLVGEHISTCLGKLYQEFERFPLLRETQDMENEKSVESYFELQCEFTYSRGKKEQRIESYDPYSTTMVTPVSKEVSNNYPTENISDCPRISQEMWSLYEEHVLCDLELLTPTSSLSVHKIVLCSRSPVFTAMFSEDMKEKIKTCIEIEDIENYILSKFILFLYTDKFEELERNDVIGLYYASDKYQVQRLKALCCSYFLQNIDVDNACELLLLADRHHDSDFQRRIEDFILKNDEKIFGSMNWKQFVDEQPLLGAKTMILRHDKKRELENVVESKETNLLTHGSLEDDLATAYKNTIISDITIKTADATFQVHRCVLAASSSVLREKLTKDLTEGKKTDSLEILDLENDTVSRVLQFLYADSLDPIEWDIAIKLYHAAHVYQIQRLKWKCACYLMENIDNSKASYLLMLADESEDEKFKSVVEDYILSHDEEIFGSDEWAELSESHSRLANKTMRLKYRKRPTPFNP